MYSIARPGKVYISSVNSTCHSVTIDWVVPLDENDIPYAVRLKYSYTMKLLNVPVPFQKNLSGAFAKYVALNLPSDTPVKFSLRAITKKGKKGPVTSFTVKTRKPSESICYVARVHYICVRIRMYTCNFMRYFTVHLINTCFGFLKLYIYCMKWASQYTIYKLSKRCSG